MTNIITRYFDNVETMDEAANELVVFERFSPHIIETFTSSQGLVEKLTQASVERETAQAYADKLARGGGVMLVRAGFRPLAVAQTTRNITAQFGAHELPGLVEDVYIHEPQQGGVQGFRQNPHILTRRIDSRRRSKTHHMADWPIPLISRRKPFREMVFEPHARMANFPIGLISKRKPYTDSVIPRHGRMANFPIPLLSKRKPFTGSIFAPHARMANFPIGLISKRKPFTGSLIGKHTRMAGWPFPHLIDGETGKNSLMPNGPRMANFPISLLSGRKPFTGSIFSRHARMANFPIGLISKRKPFTGSAIPKHGRMANFILPLIIRSEPSQNKSGFSLSRMFGIPTISRR